MAEHTPAFDPSRYLSKVKGNDYLEVKWRLVWLRDQYPDAHIETDLISHNGTQAIFRAKVTIVDRDGAIRGTSTGWGAEEVTGFMNYVEKAETKAIGRALAALGFGTQFAGVDFEEGGLADSPIGGTSPEPVRYDRRGPEPQRTTRPPQANAGGATDGQIRAIFANSKTLNWPRERLIEFLQGIQPDDLTRDQASKAIAKLQEIVARGNQ